ncbi:YceH family protein [Sansalvadorimonas sp. 2012CJ34-2]|uniref:YceH family protein n=1 Tax=Parendozoicomonas callyspongiae TaxID=2942213 RepID=A0ABT0PFE7_9GAMM|nr:YceH family protein [Sansalvadorimonas sp. 2012CJ34-2]MCL6270110.1 YceH family protein [Sansalvadorimonas sp. 2012CJ34-2]
MDINLTLNEARVIGCLLEKESTTPDQYPLSLNALVNACNQKSNRAPVLSLTNAEIMQALNSLMEQRMVSEDSGARVSRYRHRFCNTQFSTLQFSEQERAIVCVMLLRGPQTPGELRSRTGRMAEFKDVKETEAVLMGMADKELVVQLPREAGKRESRFAHLFSGDVEVPTTADLVADDKARIRELEHEITVLKAEVARLQAELEARS